MTNYLNSAMLSAGASCFGAIIEIEKNMSQAEINALRASEKMMDAQPTMMTALQNSFEAKAHDTLVSGLIGGIGSVVSGFVQLGITGYGAKLAKAASKAPAEVKLDSNLAKDIPDTSKSQNSQAATVVGKNAKSELTPEEVEANRIAAEKAKEEADKEQKKRDKDAKAISAQYSNYAQIFGPMINGAATAIKSPTDMDLVRKDGTAQAVSSLMSGNQTAQGSNANMVQTYKDAFTNASQVLAGIVSAQRN